MSANTIIPALDDVKHAPILPPPAESFAHVKGRTKLPVDVLQELSASMTPDTWRKVRNRADERVLSVILSPDGNFWLVTHVSCGGYGPDAHYRMLQLRAFQSPAGRTWQLHEEVTIAAPKPVQSRKG